MHCTAASLENGVSCLRKENALRLDMNKMRLVKIIEEGFGKIGFC